MPLLYNKKLLDSDTSYFCYIRGYPVEGTPITGDFNGDNVIDTCSSTNNEECLQDTMSYLRKFTFSDKRIKPIKIEGCPYYCMINEGDLDNDGRDEIGILVGWFTSACRQYYVMSYVKNQWVCLLSLSSTYNMRVAGIDMVEKDKADSTCLIVRQSNNVFIRTLESKKRLFAGLLRWQPGAGTAGLYEGLSINKMSIRICS
jgi:hypothetical protein